MTPEKIYRFKRIIDDATCYSTNKPDVWDKTHEYIRKDIMDKAIAEERERCAKIAEDKGLFFDGRTIDRTAIDIAKAIREGS